MPTRLPGLRMRNFSTSDRWYAGTSPSWVLVTRTPRLSMPLCVIAEMRAAASVAWLTCWWLRMTAVVSRGWKSCLAICTRVPGPGSRWIWLSGVVMTMPPDALSCRPTTMLSPPVPRSVMPLSAIRRPPLVCGERGLIMVFVSLIIFNKEEKEWGKKGKKVDQSSDPSRSSSSSSSPYESSSSQGAMQEHLISSSWQASSPGPSSSQQA